MNVLAFQIRRQRLLDQMQANGGGIAILATAPEATRNSDNLYTFRHDSYFYYLSGFAEPEAILVLHATADTKRAILFCRDKDPEREIWDGFRYGPQAAQEIFGFDEAHSVSACAQIMPDLLADAGTLYHRYGHSVALDLQLQEWLRSVASKSRSGISTPIRGIDVLALIDEMRLFKDDAEIALLRESAHIAAIAHNRAMRAVKPGMHEYELEAEILHECKRRGAKSLSYDPIVATGANACVLHYSANDALIQNGDLILIDAGCEYASYASDITRSFPANGRFSSAQAALYSLVLAAQQAALDCAQPGRRYLDGHDAAVRVLTSGMLELGLLQKDKVGSLDDAIASLAYKQFYMHGTGHWLGLDVHDTGRYRMTERVGDEKPYRQLEAGMVITIEPGLYVRPAEGVPEQYWNIGIRIEDDILITPNGHDNLSHEAVKSIAEIESLMQGK